AGAEREAELRATDDRPVADPPLVQPGGGELPQAPLSDLTGRGEVPGIPEERDHIELRLGDERLRVDREPPAGMAQQVVMVEVAVHEDVVARRHRVEAIRRDRDVRVIAPRREIVEPAGHLVARAPERATLDRPPELA